MSPKSTNPEVVPDEDKLTPEEVNQKLGPPPKDADVPLVNGKFWLPSFHPAAGIPEGKYKAVGGTLVAANPKIPDQFPSADLPGFLPDDIQKHLSQTTVGLRDEAYRKTLASLLAEYYGQGFSTENRQKLAQVYLQSSNEAAIIREKLVGKKKVTGKEIEQARQQLAQIMGQCAFAELKLFASNASSKSPRFSGLKLDAGSLDKSLQDDLQKGYQSLLDGSYLKHDKEAIALEAKTPEAPKAVADVAHTATEFDETRHEPQTYGWQVKIFVAEHFIDPSFVIGFDESDARDYGLVHTGVIAGIWRLQKTHISRKPKEPTVSGPIELPPQPFQPPEVIHVSKPALPKSPTGSYAAHLLPGVEKKVTEYSEVFYGWQVANGCASWFNQHDNLRLCAYLIFRCFEDARQYIFGFTPGPQGHYRRVRACAYSVGTYGLNWVCHQNANAFTSRRWGLEVVDSPFKHLLGNCGNYASSWAGNFPVSEHDCPVIGCDATQYGGVPCSVWNIRLHYQISPFMNSPTGLLVNLGMSGLGKNLNICYIPGTGYTESHASYIEYQGGITFYTPLTAPPVEVPGWE